MKKIVNNINKLFDSKKKIILDQWFECALAIYSSESIDCFKNNKDNFHNPIGNIIQYELGALFEELLNGLKNERVSFSIGRIVRIRAVQDYTPSQALRFILELKSIIRKILTKELHNVMLVEDFFGELFAFELLIDKLMLIAVDAYMDCRLKICELRAEEVKNMYYNILRRSDIACST